VSISAYCRRRRRRPSRSTAAPPLIRDGGEAPIFYILGCLVVGAVFFSGRNPFCFSYLAGVVIVICLSLDSCVIRFCFRSDGYDE
jgi:hypothetical protein